MLTVDTQEWLMSRTLLPRSQLSSQHEKLRVLRAKMMECFQECRAESCSTDADDMALSRVVSRILDAESTRMSYLMNHRHIYLTLVTRCQLLWSCSCYEWGRTCRCEQGQFIGIHQYKPLQVVEKDQESLWKRQPIPRWCSKHFGKIRLAENVPYETIEVPRLIHLFF